MFKISELFNELTLTHINDPIPLIENKVKVKELKQAMDGLLQVLVWRLEGTITQEEFT